MGKYESVAFKSRSIQLKIDAATEIVKFDPKSILVVEGGEPRKAEAMRDMRKGHEAKIAYVENDGVKTATKTWFKGPIRIDPGKLVHYEDVAALVAKGPEAGDYVLVDSRPLPRVQEGTIPTSINLPFTTKGFDALARGKLPADKAKRIIFFCQGITCMLSPNSLLRAEAMGYTNARVYREGWPGWTKKNVGVLAGSHLKEAWIANYPVATGAPATTVAYVPRPRAGDVGIEAFRKLVARTPADTLILDVRNTDEGNAGMIKGAKLIPDEDLLARLGELPKDKPLVAYCSTGVRAEMASHKLRDKGYNAAFVKADVEIDKAGRVTLSAN